jgi:hypothetical protein
MSASALSTSEFKGGNKLSEVSTGGRRRKTRNMRKSRRGSKSVKRTNKRRSNRRRK